MSLFKSVEEQLKEDYKYGFELALKYVELAIKYDLDPVVMLREKLEDWE